jgi:hypothetical protein
VRATEGDPVCYNDGKRFEPGTITCIVRGEDASKKLARCDNLDGEGQWTILADTCPTAELNRQDLLDRLHPATTFRVRASFVKQ